MDEMVEYGRRKKGRKWNGREIANRGRRAKREGDEIREAFEFRRNGMRKIEKLCQ